MGSFQRLALSAFLQPKGRAPMLGGSFAHGSTSKIRPPETPESVLCFCSCQEAVHVVKGDLRYAGSSGERPNVAGIIIHDPA